MSHTEPTPIYLKDYTPPPYTITTTELTVELIPNATRVRSRLQLQRQRAGEHDALQLDGEELKLISLAINGDKLSEADYHLNESGLLLLNPPAHFILESEVELNPAANAALEGLYLSSGNFCTQCEAEGFRRISWYLDRPDVMATFTTTLIADRDLYPVLLSNGNCIDQQHLDHNRHQVTWHDPFPKPSYLFALVGGNLVEVADSFTTCSGREVAIRFYVEPGNEGKCDHAIASLKRAMRWDEEHYGREYDLDIYMVVAVNDFNMGAMENKGLNIFNSRYVLANPETATDSDFDSIEGVIAHEYFHNWSGNRITCRDWFQLSLKEGFTVFRDQQFSADMSQAAVRRIESVRMLRTYQFAEDSGPMSHPVRPESYVEINNFYTLTVYEKGAELIRMLHTLLGAERFRKGTDLYFKRHDGQAVTCDDWLEALADANELDLSPFLSWYHQAGTPTVTVKRDYDPQQATLTLTLSQQLPPAADGRPKAPQPIPIRCGLIGAEGQPIALQLSQEGQEGGGQEEQLLLLEQFEQTFTLYHVPPNTTPSLLRQFSAPVKLHSGASAAELAQLMACDTDEFNRWDAGQQLAEQVLLNRYHHRPQGDIDTNFSAAYQRLLDSELDESFKADALTLPDILYLMERVEAVEPLRLFTTLRQLQQQLTEENHPRLLQLYQQRQQDRRRYTLNAAEIARRKLKNRLLSLLAETESEQIFELAWQQYQQADNMTDAISALGVLVHHLNRYRDEALNHFYCRWQNEPLVLDKWFAIQATAPLEQTLEDVKRLSQRGDFLWKNPNRVRSLVASFAMRNVVAFHTPGGSGYQFVTEVVSELNRFNPQIAARLVTPLTQWRRYTPTIQQQMQHCLQQLLELPNLSRDLYEVVHKSLN
ncbi:aminopeptidase N [Ectothiorhodospiraceae bacterium BW-2]|nr:aminopeptidase N [Ectothiorhodospiraceae bacterium BW-2]